MSLISRLRKWYNKNVLQMTLTPKGECLRDYLLKLEKGSDDHIVPYDEYVEYIQKLMLEQHGIKFTFMETVNLLTAYFDEYFE